MSKAFPNIDIVSLVVCDEIRKEDNGKAILIGVYSGDILVNELPIQIGISLWVHLNVSGPGEIPFEFRFVGIKSAVSELSGNANIKGAGAAIISTPPIPVLLESEGELKIEMKYGDSDWRLVRSLEIRKKN